MQQASTDGPIHDLFIVGGGVNGCGIARDAAGRGLSVLLAEMGDLASATSSNSTKLLHGGLRYLEYFEIRLVREALAEREVLLRAMPHIAEPMRFVLPYHAAMRFDVETPASRLLKLVMPWMKGRRPSWMIRLGLFIYDHLGGREILPGASTVDLGSAIEGDPLKDTFRKAYEYSDCRVDDSRLVVLNACDAQARGARVLVRTKMVSASCENGLWVATLEDAETGERRVVRSRVLVNAGGPWVDEIIRAGMKLEPSAGIRLVRGSHIVTRKLYDHDKCYFLQGADGRIVFTIPYQSDFTLIGTTEQDHPDPSVQPECTPAEQDYLCDFVSGYFKRPITRSDIVWTYSGVRPLLDEGTGSATAATREYTLEIDERSGAPALNVFGGKITTYRRLAEHAMEKLAPWFPQMTGNWTSGAALPGGDFPVDGMHALKEAIANAYPFLDAAHAGRLARAYGTQAFKVLGEAKKLGDLGRSFGGTLTQREVVWLMEHEFARTAQDVVWRRSKLGLAMSPQEIDSLADWMKDRRAVHAPQAR